MKITIESTTKIVSINDVPARIWEGHTESGVPIHCYITRIACDTYANQSEFQELQQHKPPSAELQAIPLRMIIG